MSAEAIPLHSRPAHPPMFSVEAEKSVIGGLIAKPDLAPVAFDALEEWMFHLDAHRRIWRAIQALVSADAAIDGSSLAGRLKEAGDMEGAGGVGYLAEISDWVPTTSDSNIRYNAGVIRRHAMRRRIHDRATAIQEFVRSAADADPEHLQAEVERIIGEAMLKRTAGSEVTRLGDHLWPEMERLQRLEKGEDVTQGVKTGLRAVDERLLAMQPGDLVIVAGRPSMGKSALGVCNIASDAAIRQNKRTAVFSLETRKEPLVRRILASEARVNMWAAQKNRGLLDHEYPQLAQVAGQIKSAPMHIDYAPGLTLDRMRATLRDLTREEGAPELVVVDYLQLMSVPKERDPYKEVSAISKGLKEIAGEFGVVMVALSQLSRAVESRPDKKPMMSDLRESGRLEQDADVIMLLYRPEYYFGPTMKIKKGAGKSATEETISIGGKAEIILTKVREGETGTAHCAWEGKYTHFEDMKGFSA